MFLFILKIYLRILAACWSTFGFGKEILLLLFINPCFTVFTFATFFLDALFYPAYRKIQITKPIFIIGHPRSGTTFLHRLITQTREFVVFEFWHILFPSLTARRLVGPVVRALIRRGKDVVYPKEVGHEMTLTTVEEEEVLFTHIVNSQFIGAISTPLGFGDSDFEELVEADRQPESVRHEAMTFFRECLKRQACFLGLTQVITKMNYSGMRLRSLMEAFPDAKLIYLIRSPYETIPSHLSLHRNMIDHRWGIQNIPAEALHRYFERRYRYNVRFYRYLEELFESGALIPSQCLVVSYQALKNNLGKVMEDIVRFTGISLSPELTARIDEQIRKQAIYQPKHRNLDLQTFGLTRERIAEDLGFIFDKYGFPK